MFKDCIIMVFLWKFWSKTNDNSYFASFLKHVISSCTIGYTWKLFLNNGDNKYKLSLHFILDKVMYIKPCFVTLDESNARWSRVKPCAQCIVRVVTSCIGNCILMIIYEGLLAICIFVIFHFIGVWLFWRFWICIIHMCILNLCV